MAPDTDTIAIDVRIVDVRRAPLGERRVGGIEVRGPSVMREYLDQPEATVRGPDGPYRVRRWRPGDRMRPLVLFH